MASLKNKKILISGASIAGLTAAWWMNHLGYQVTVVEIANLPRTNGAAVDIKGTAIGAIKRMGIYHQLKSYGLSVDLIEFKNADDVTEGSIKLLHNGDENREDEIEIERDKFMSVLTDELKNNVEFMFNNSIAAMHERENQVQVVFKDGAQRSFDLVLGCDGMHSGVRKLWFGHEAAYSHFMEAYFSITTVDKLLVEQRTMQMYNVPDKAITLNAYADKTDIIFCFFSDKEIPYNYRDTDQQRAIIVEQFAGQIWRTAELLREVQQSDNFYFDKFCQIKMPSWTKGRIALVGDAGYCASPAAGMGASLSINGAAALADALAQYNGDHRLAFQEYDKNLRPFIESVQAMAELNVKENFIPRTEEAIYKRNTQLTTF